MTRIALLGSRGRMGTHVRSLLASEFSSRASLVQQADQGDDPALLVDSDAVIDFSTPDAFCSLARVALSKQAKQETLPVFVTGTTGWSLEQSRSLDALAARTPLLSASNFSLGVFLLQRTLKAAAPSLRKLGYTPVMVETHHCHKKDAPSGTALWLNRAVRSGGYDPVQTHSIRAGEVIGRHEVTFHGAADELVFSHHAQDRSVFARGAIDCALWLLEHHSQLPRRVLSLEDLAGFFDV